MAGQGCCDEAVKEFSREIRGIYSEKEGKAGCGWVGLFSRFCRQLAI